MLELRPFSVGQREPLPQQRRRDLRQRARTIEAILTELQKRRDPGTDIFDGTATGCGTSTQRERWASARREAAERIKPLDDGPPF